MFENLEFKYHGNYGGPNYTGGRKDGGFDVAPIDDLDETFRKHDYDYTKMDHDDADALWLERARSLPWSLKKQAAQLGFSLKNLGHRHVKKPNYSYPWEEPPAVTSRGGFKIADSVVMSGRGRGRFSVNAARKRGKRALMTRARSKAIVRKNKRTFRKNRNRVAKRGGVLQRMAGRRTYSAPLQRSNAFRGNQLLSLPGRMSTGVRDINRVRTRVYLGAISVAVTTGNTIFSVNNVNNAGNWYCLPSNAAYFNNGTFNNLARCYTKYKINSFRFDFESLIPPGNTTGYL